MNWKPPSKNKGEISSIPSQYWRGKLRKQVLQIYLKLPSKEGMKVKGVILVGEVALTHRMSGMSGVMFSPLQWVRFLFCLSVSFKQQQRNDKHWDWNLLKTKPFFPQEEFYCTWETCSDQNCRHSAVLYYLKNWGHSFFFTLNRVLLYLRSSWANPCVCICVFFTALGQQHAINNVNFM